MSLSNKLMGQVNLVRVGLNCICGRGSFTLTSGVPAREPMPGSAAISLINAALEGFVRAAALAKHFVSAEIRCFTYSEHEEALTWLKMNVSATACNR